MSENKYLIFHCGRVTLAFDQSEEDYNFIINKILTSTGTLGALVLYGFGSMPDSITQDCERMTNWATETWNAIAANEYWFEYFDQDLDPSTGLDQNKTPHERWVEIQPRLDKKHVLIQ